MPLTLHKPDYAELSFRQQMLADEETMSYNLARGGTIDFPETRWGEWYSHWVVNTDGKRFYRYVMDDTGAFVGEAAYHYDDELGVFLADVIIYSKYRGKGFGREALSLLCSSARANGVTALCDNIAADNPSIVLFLKQGFKELYRDGETVMLRKEL